MGGWTLRTLFGPSLVRCVDAALQNVDWVENKRSEKLSKRHRRHAGKPLVRYWTLDIAPMRRVLETEGDLTGSGLRQALHICRGHFKTYGPEAPLFGQHTGTYWWPSYARGDRKLGEISKDYRIRIDDEGLGRPYRAADEQPELVSHSEGRGEPDLSGRGLAAHAMVQNRLAELIAAAGLRPLSPRPEEPQFDLAWETPAAIWIVEVKSLTPANEESQLRAGLAQLLRYRQLLDAGDREVHCVLAVEVPPSDTSSDKSWVRLCEDEEIRMLWPATFDEVIGASLGSRD